MTGQEQLRLSLANTRAEPGEHGVVLVNANGRLPLPECSPGLRAVLLQLCSTGANETELVSLARELEPSYSLASLFFHLRSLARVGLLNRTVMLDGAALATLVPLTHLHEFALPELAPDRALVLSRFAFLRRDAGALVLESPTTHARLVLHDRRATTLVHELATGEATTLDQLHRELAELLPAPTITLLARILLGNGWARASVDGRTHDESPVMATWSFADLLFHTRSRIGRHDGVMGKSYPFLGKLDPLPAIKPIPQGQVIELPRPNLEELQRTDRSFTSVLESRSSIRIQGDPPIRLEQLAELLYRAARIRGFTPATPDVHYEITDRPSPGGGACHELEIYLAINRCEGLERGLYHYDPAEHRLTQVAGPSAALEQLLYRTGVATGTGLITQVLVCLAARFQRMAWPYEGIAYATTLKNVGALLQTMYLVATAMDLAPSAIGYGDSDLFAQVAKTDYYCETTVGEFLLGSRPG